MKELDNFIIRGSSAGLVRNGEYLSSSDVACPRKTILRHLKIEETHSATTKEVFAIGHLFEEWYCAQYPDAIREMLITAEGLEGHSDLVTDEYVVELKSVTSKNTYKSVIKQGKPKPQNVLQLLVYMVALEREKGLLVYGSYCHVATYDKLIKMRPHEIAPLFKDAVPELKEFLVEIDQEGYALVDGEHYYNIHVSEIMEFQSNLHELVRARILPPRVEALNSGSWDSPCRWCKLPMLCDQNPSDLEDFVEQAAEIYEALSEIS